MSKLAIFFLVRILIFKLYFISIPGNNAKNLLNFDYYKDQNCLILNTYARDYSIPNSYAKNLLRLNIYNMFSTCVSNSFQLKLVLV